MLKAAAFLLCSVVAVFPALSAVPPSQSDLDALMARVLDKRDENWKKLRQYLLDEREEVTMAGPAGLRLWGDRREYTWFIRDGIFVRSPTRANGVNISDADRRRYEDLFIRRAREREKNTRNAPVSTSVDSGGPTGPASGADLGAAPSDMPASADAFLSGVRQPQFIDTAYFLRFKFEKGHYAFVGRETVAGHGALRIEYYPEQLFTHEQRDQDQRRSRREQNRDEDVEAATERMMNKVALVTLWVEPSAQQILKYTFDNVDLDFLPAAHFLRVNQAQAVMTMAQPFPAVWLPATVDIRIGAMFAAGAVDMRYGLEYYNYREAATTGRVLVPTAP